MGLFSHLPSGDLVDRAVRFGDEKAFLRDFGVQDYQLLFPVDLCQHTGSGRKKRGHFLFADVREAGLIGEDGRSSRRGARMPHSEPLRGHTTGYAVPQYVIDAPGGGGKVPINPDYILSQDEERIVIRNYEGKTFEYPEAPDGTPLVGAAKELTELVAG